MVQRVNLSRQMLPAEERRRLKAAWARVTFMGTPENYYLDSGFWEYIKYVKTFNEHAKGDDVVAPLPYWKEYIQIIFLHMLNSNMLLIPKSRQIIVSWCLSAFASWYARTGPHRRIVIQSRVREDAEEIVSKGDGNPTAGRIAHIEHELPSWLADPHIINGSGNKVGELIYTPAGKDAGEMRPPWAGSRIIATAQGPHQARSKTVSLFISDEAAIQEEFEEAVAALLATVSANTGSAKFIAASSVMEGSYFNKLCLESHDDDIEEFVGDGIPHLAGLYEKMNGGSLPHGIATRTTPSEFDVLQVHYYADPDKSDETEHGREWIEKTSKRYGGRSSHKWRREFEIDYTASGSALLFPYLSDSSKIRIPRITVRQAKDMGLAVYAGFDYGSTNPSAFAVWGVSQDNKCYLLWEMYKPCKSIPRMAAEIKSCPFWDMIQYIKCDPAIVNTKGQHTDSGQKSIAEMFAENGVIMRPGRRGADINLYHRLSDLWSDLEHPRAFICNNCIKSWWEFQRLRWQRHTSDRVAMRKSDPEKIVDKNNHMFDASAYVLDSRPMPMAVRRRIGNSGLTFESVKQAMAHERRQKELEQHYVGSR